MKIETKYEVGQEVWTLGEIWTDIDIGECPVCKGRDVSIFDSNKICGVFFGNGRRCHGGRLYKHDLAYMPIKCSISDIEINIDDMRKIYIDYRIDGENSLHAESDIYSTLEDAKRKCDKRNAKK